MLLALFFTFELKSRLTHICSLYRPIYSVKSYTETTTTMTNVFPYRLIFNFIISLLNLAIHKHCDSKNSQSVRQANKAPSLYFALIYYIIPRQCLLLEKIIIETTKMMKEKMALYIYTHRRHHHVCDAVVVVF